MSISVVIPFHASDEWRVKAWEYVSAWWCKHFPDWELIKCSAGPWTKGRALHNGVKLTEGSTLVLADADSFVREPAHKGVKSAEGSTLVRADPDSFTLSPDELAELVARVDRRGGVPWLMPHRYVHRVSQQAPERIYADEIVDIHDINYPIYGGCVGGGMTVLTRQAWKTVKGVDPRFVGWG